MEQGEMKLLVLLRAFYEETPLTPSEMEEIILSLESVLHLAKIHQVTGIVAYKIREYYEIHEPADAEEQEISDIAAQIFSVTVQKTAPRAELYQKLSKALKDAEIDHLAFKGIEVKDLYAVPELRTFGDIDIVIRKEDRVRCHALMQELDYTVHVGHEPVFTYQKDKEYYEIHTSIMSVNITERADYIAYFSNLWDYAQKKNDHVYAFTPEFHFVYLLSHIAKHIYSSGAGIRMYLDLAFYIKHLGTSMNWSMVEKELEKLNLKRFFHLSLQCLDSWFGTQTPVVLEKAEDSLVNDFTAFTMAGGVFGFEGKTVGEMAVRKAGMLEADGMRRRALFKTLFPPAESIQARYTYLQKRPYLLPFAWVDRVFRNHRRIGAIVEETKDIVAVNEEEIQKTNAFYRMIGL